MTNQSESPTNPTNQNDISTISADGDVIIARVGQGAEHVYIGKDIHVTIQELKSLEDQPAVLGDPPYKGLTFYTQHDEALYFGRRTLARDLIGTIATHPFGAITGGSGSGKSSLLRAGVVPTLARSGWHIAIMTPADQPLARLAASLFPDEGTEHLTFLDQIVQDDQTLLLTVARWANAAPAKRVLLLVDQFEELFTLAKDEATNRKFVANLLAARTSQTLSIVILLRADFFARCDQYDGLPTALANQPVYLERMNRSELRDVILEPLRQNGWRLQEGLDDLILDDAGDEPGSLPFLSHALRETWERRRANVLTLSGYQQAGGVKGAIAATAEAAWQQLAKVPGAQDAVKMILIELTELGERDGTEVRTPDTRRRRTYADLASLSLPPATLDAALEELLHRRLLTRDDHDYIEVAHEALIRAWHPLQAWLDADRARLRMQRQLQADAQRWQVTGSPDDLYRGARLAGAQEWAKAQSNTPAGLIADFLQASLAGEEGERRKELEHAQNLAAEQSARARTFRWAAIIASALLVVALIVSYVAYDRQRAAVASEATAQAQSTRADQQAMAANDARATSDINAALAATRAAEAQAAQADAEAVARLAQSRALAAAAQSLVTIDPMRAWLLSIEAGNLADTDQAFSAINQQDQAVSKPLMAFAHDNGVYGAAWNGDESRILSWSADNTVRLWDVPSGALIHTFAHKSFVWGAMWNGDESNIVSWSADGTVQVWSATSGELLHTLAHQQGGVRGAMWNEDESRIVSWGDDSTVRVWDTASGELLHILDHEGAIYNAAWNKDWNRILSWGDTSTVHVWDVASGDLLQTFKHEGYVNGAAWNGDESRILSWSDDGTVRVWNAASGELLQTFKHEGIVQGAMWNGDESHILSWSNDGTVRVWNAASGELLHSFEHEGIVGGAIWNKNENHILSWSDDQLNPGSNVQVWDTASGELLHSFEHERIVREAIWNEDESRILSWGDDATVRVWDAGDGELLYTLAYEGAIKGAMWNKDESRILSWGDDATVRVWDAGSGDLIHTLAYEGAVNGATWNKDESRILSWSGDVLNRTSIVQVWAADSGKLLHTLEHEGIVRGAMWNEDESRIVSWGDDGTVRVWDTASGDLLHILEHRDYVNGVTWSSDESRILSWSDDGTIRAWAADSGELLHTLEHQGPVRGAAWSEDESRILSWSADNTVRLLDAASGELLHTFEHQGPVFGVAWNEDESQILSWSDDGTVRVWNAASGELLHTFEHQGPVFGVAWNEDESQILSRSNEQMNPPREVRVWDAGSGELLHTLEHQDAVRGAVWNGNGSRILSWSDDGTVRLWDPQTEVALLTLLGDGSRVSSAQWNDDESQIMITTTGGKIYRYYTHMTDLLAAACTRATHNFTWSEWQQYVPGEPYRQTCPNLPVHPSVLASAITPAATPTP